MVQQLFKENTRRSTVIKILKTHVPKSVEDIKGKIQSKPTLK